MPLPLLIDCDPGVDDAIALLLAFASPELDVLGISTVAGNVPLPLTQTNARKICELVGRTATPVYAGCPRPILGTLQTAETVHGTTGLGNVQLPEPTLPLQRQHGVDFLIATLMEAAEPLTLATLGPLTNVAIALIKEPRIVTKVRELVMMGGAVTYGNVTPTAEFNIYVDPHAAQIVLSSGMCLTMITLDVTHHVLTTPERLERIRAIATPLSAVAADLLSSYTHEVEHYGWAGSPLHDPCVIAYLVQPELFTGSDRYIEVEITSPLTMGQTVVDERQLTCHQPNVKLIQHVNVAGFYDLLISRLAKLSAPPD